MEFLDIVNKDGKKTGLVCERGKVHDLNLLHWEVVVFIVNDKGEILLQKRSANKRFYPNKYALLSGLVISGETIEEAAKREIKEELGLEINISDLNVMEENLALTRIFYVKCNYKESDFKIQKSELSKVKWYNIDTIIDMINSNDSSIIIKKDRIYLLERLKKMK